MSTHHPPEDAFEHAASLRRGAIALLTFAFLTARGIVVGGDESGFQTEGRFLGVTERRESLHTSRGVRNAWFAKADRPDATIPGILILEPRGTDRTSSRERARLLASLGAAVLVVTVDPSDEATTSTLEDARAGFDRLHGMRLTSDQPHAIIGIGSASGTALRLASAESRVSACAVDRHTAEAASFAVAQMRGRMLVLPAPLSGRSPLGSTSTDALVRFLGETILPELPTADSEEE